MKQLFFHELKQNVRWDIYMTLLWLKKWNINDLALFTEIVNSRLFLQKAPLDMFYKVLITHFYTFI